MNSLTRSPSVLPASLIPRSLLLALSAAACLAPSCAIRRFDATTNTVEWWGIGHFSARVAAPEDGVQAVAVSGEVAGVGASYGDGGGLSLGWNRWQRLWITKPNVALALRGPSSQLIELTASGFRRFVPSTAHKLPPAPTIPSSSQQKE